MPMPGALRGSGVLLMHFGNAGDALLTVAVLKSISRTSWLLFSLWFGNSLVLDSGGWSRVASGLSGFLPSEHPRTRVILTRLVPKFAVAVDFLI